MIDQSLVASRILEAVRNKKPFSFVRLGDGEGALSRFGRNATLEDIAYFQNHFGKDVTVDDIVQIRQNMEQAILSADLIGVRNDVLSASADALHLDLCSPQFLERFKAAFPLRENESKSITQHAAKRIFQLFQRLQEGFPEAAEICSQWVCYDLAEEDFWEQLLLTAGKVGIITSSPLLKLRLERRFGIPVVAHVTPGQEKELAVAAALRHYPRVHREILASLERPLDGMLFLVGAGLVGKNYLGVIKRNGGIALDIGALFDAWQGRPTRGAIYVDKAPLEASRFTAPARYRLAAGVLGSAVREKRPRLVFHAGFSRTSTTALQTAFAKNEARLAGHGVNYLTAARGEAINHHELARAFGMGEAESVPDRKELSRLLESIDDEINERPDYTHVLSSELFTNTSPHAETEDDLIEFVRSYDTTVVVLVRNQFDWLLSWYGKAASNRNVDQKLDDFMLKPKLEKFDGNFLRKIRWFQRYLTRPVEVVSYDLNKADTLSAFARAASIEIPAIEVTRENASPVPSGLVSGIAARKLSLPIKSFRSVEWPPEIVERLLCLGEHASQREKLRAAVMQLHSPVNDRIAREFGVRL